MNILYTLNDKFVPQVGASICSLCENNKEINKIVFYIISCGITPENKKRLENLVISYKRNIKIIEFENLETYFNFSFDTSGWNVVVLVRLLVDKFLPSNVDKVIYIDGDTIIRGELYSLWNLNLKGKTMGLSIEPTANKNLRKKLGLENYPYYNAGVLLIDLKKWRLTNASDRIIKYYKENNGHLFANDQDAINAVMKDEILTISPKYNFYNIYNQYSYNFLKKILSPVDYISQDEFNDAVKNPIIIHYLGEERPWRAGNHHKYKKDYLKYLQMTPWKNTPMEEGWRFYYICWTIFNTLTKPFPSLRYKIMSYLIPKFIEYRAKNK